LILIGERQIQCACNRLNSNKYLWGTLSLLGRALRQSAQEFAREGDPAGFTVLAGGRAGSTRMVQLATAVGDSSADD
jgi:hypothetical protein